MTEIILTEGPEVGAGEAALIAAELPVVRVHLDTYADESEPTHNFGDRAKLKLNGGAGSDSCQAFIFLARPFPLGSTILEATLRIYLAGAWAGTQEITAKRITDSWKERRLTWEDRPAASATNAATAEVTDGAVGDEVAFDVAALLGDVSAGSDFYGIRLELDDDADRKLWSSEGPQAELRPVLELDWIVPPLPPTHLAPSGGRSISLASPLLTWRFRDPEDEGQTASQVQVSEDEDFAVVEYDSGKLTNAESQWDLSDTAYAGIGDGETRFWRVKVWDEGDLESGWSDTEEFRRDTKGALTIVNPAAAPDDYVEETTPPLDWTFTGRTQERATVWLARLDEDGLPSKLIERWRVEEETRVHVPRNTLKSGHTYRLVVRVWDDFDRQAMANDPDYVQADRDFTYERSGTPSAVTALTATPDGPKVVLSWTRATQPDYFSLRVDGEEVEDRIDPDDVFDAGTTYEMDYWGAIPRTEHTYEVEAVVNDAGKLKHSDGNATDAATTKPKGIWIVEDESPADILAVMLEDQEPANLQLGEVGETFNLIGSRKPVRITDSVRGYEGSVSGGVPSTAERDTFFEIKGRLRKVRLILAELNIPVILGEASIAPTPDPRARYLISVDVVQVGDFPMTLTGD